MSLATLENKEPKEILRLLSAVSSSLLPNPSISELAFQAEIKTGAINSVIDEIRRRLNIPDNDFSILAQSKIMAFLSKEISNHVLSDENINKVKKRLGSKGELLLSQYRIDFADTFKSSEALGEKKSNIIEIVKNPDRFIHFNSRYLLLDDDNKFGFTLLTKLITPKRIQDKFIQIVFSTRQGDSLLVVGTFRAYFSEMNLNQLENPVQILKTFINTYGLIFKINNLPTKFMVNDIVEVINKPLDLKILDGQKGTFYLPLMIGNESGMAGNISPDINLGEILIAFAVDISKYSAMLEKHNVYLIKKDWHFLQIE